MLLASFAPLWLVALSTTLLWIIVFLARQTFSSLVSFCIVCAAMKWCSLALSSSNSSMHTGSIDVTHVHVCYFTRQHCLLLHKNSIANVLIISMSWIIIYANCIFTLYTFPSTHSKDDDECGDDLTSKSWIFKWFHWILNEFIGYSERRLVGKEWIHWSNEWRLVNCTHIL